MSNPVHGALVGAKGGACPDGPSPAQERLLADIRDELARLEALALRAARLNAVRLGSPAALALRCVRSQINDTLSVLGRIDRLGGSLDIEHGEDWTRLRYVSPPATVTELSEYRARLAERHRGAV